jgi:hypothetical protein
MIRASFRLLLLACFSLFHVEASAGRPASHVAPPPALLRVDAHEALRRARLEQSLIRAEKTAVLLGELAAVRNISE